MRKPIHDYMEFTDLKDMLNKTGKIYGDRPAYVFKTEEKGKFREITHKEFRDDINSLGTALIELGLKGKRVAVISDNRYEWGLVYLAVATGVGVIVPLDKALPDNEIESLMMRSEIEAIVYSKKYDEVMNRVREEKNTNVKYFISMDIEKNEKEVYSLKQLLEKGKKKIEDGDREFLDAKINAEINNIKNAEFFCGDASLAAEKLAQQGIKADCIIIDPPRKGCDSTLINTISEKFSPPRVIYISCDPATLARDLKIFNELGYSAFKVIPVDLFPRTGHVETVCLLSRK